MLLALDVGNTNVTVGVFSGVRLVRQWRMETRAIRAVRPLAGALLSKTGRLAKKIDAVIYGSVVPALDRTLEKAARRAFGCRALAVTPSSPLGIRLRVRRPRQVGADRLLNALAAHARARGPAVVVDFGTATTFDCVSRRGDYLGGAILPGPALAGWALAERTAKLPLVPVRRPRRAIGKDTVECIRAGLYFGYLGMIEKVLGLTLREMSAAGIRRRPALLATGGLSRLFQEDLPRGMRRVPALTLEGLRIAYERLR